MNFIGTYWKQNHILAKNRDFFEWMYVDEKGCNFILSIDEKGDVNGIEGYIPYNNSDNPDVAGTMWKVLKTDNPLLGMEIGKMMYKIANVRADAAPGLTKRAVKINQMLGYLGGRLEHYYLLNNQVKYKLALAPRSNYFFEGNSSKKFVSIQTKEQLSKIILDEEQRKKAPYKDLSYLIHRYMQHPIYHYDLLGIQDHGKDIRCIIVGRMVEYEGTNVYKIIDILGDFKELKGTKDCFYELLQKKQLEYIDLYCFGVPKEYIFSAGFVERIGDEVIIPNYFEPFERKNIDIYFAASVSEGLVLFRGDGDQDRPS